MTMGASGPPGDAQSHFLATLIDRVLNEPQPPMSGAVDIPLLGNTPIEQAFHGLCLAVNAVIEADNAILRRDWEERQNRVLEWRAHLQQHSIPDAKVASAGIAAGELDVETALVGIRQWEEMLSEVEDLVRWAGERYRESGRKVDTVGEVMKRALAARERGDDRVQQIVRSSERRIRRLGPSRNDDSRQRIVAAARREVEAVSAVALSRMNALTRQVLELDENTAAVNIQDWLDRHGLDTRPPRD